jgi:16S rRNA (guanine527-N7)-methyltransferase
VLACALAGMPGASVHLVESNSRKAAFLREAARVTGAPAQVHAARIEDFVAAWPGGAEVVTARALAPLAGLLRHAAPLLRGGAMGLFPKGRDVGAELTEAAKYWRLGAETFPSITDSHARIVLVRDVQPLETSSLFGVKRKA